MGSGAYGDHILCDIDADRLAFLIDIREVMLRLLGILVRHVEVYMIKTMDLHLLIDGTGDDVTRSEAQPLVIFLHERLTVGQFQNAAVATHGIRDEEGGMCLTGMVETRRMELYKLHVLDFSFGTIDHSLTVTGSDDRVRRRLIDGAATAGTHHRYLTEIGVDLTLRVEDISTVAVDIW